MNKDAFLQCYPFWDTHACLAEGFSVYDGTLGDTPGDAHKGIDYTVREDDALKSFDVCAMHDGMSYQGISASWGNFVYVMRRPNEEGVIYATVYAHLECIPKKIPILPPDGGASFQRTKAMTYIGRASVSGDTKGRPQLHIELHARGATEKSIQKIDPYGINDRASSGRYPQPGNTLKRFQHFWTKDLPSFANGDPCHEC